MKKLIAMCTLNILTIFAAVSSITNLAVKDIKTSVDYYSSIYKNQIIREIRSQSEYINKQIYIASVTDKLSDKIKLIIDNQSIITNNQQLHFDQEKEAFDFLRKQIAILYIK